jgi:hypothetical protein
LPRPSLAKPAANHMLLCPAISPGFLDFREPPGTPA